MNNSQKNLVGKDLLDLLVAGKRPVIRFNKNIEDFDDGPDEGLMAKIVGYHKNDDINFIVVMCDLKPYEKYNDKLMVADWFNDKKIPCLKWNQTSYYPENGIYELYVEETDPLRCDIVEESLFYNEYKESNSELSYIEWLEEQLLKARNM